MWRYAGEVLDPGFPRRTGDLGLPRHPDAAFYYAPLGHLVVFKGPRYFVLNLRTLVQEHYYPRRLTDWTGVPRGTNGALARPDGRLFFFRERSFWRFDPLKVRVTQEGQWAQDLSWTGCTGPQGGDVPHRRDVPPGGTPQVEEHQNHHGSDGEGQGPSPGGGSSDPLVLDPQE